MSTAIDTHFKLYKPYGMLSQLSSNDAQQKNKRFLSELYDFPKGVMPIGRLDEKSEGLLLLTTDGKLSDRINRSGIEKEYYAQLDGVINSTALLALTDGVVIGFEGKKYKTKPCEVFQLSETPNLPKVLIRQLKHPHRKHSWIRIIVREGKFRQIRKMTAAVGFPTLRLVRIRVGNITIENLNEGAVQKTDMLI